MFDVNTYVTSLLEYLQRLEHNHLIKAALIFIIYCILSKIADVFIDKILKRLTAKTKVRFDDELLNLVHMPVIWTVIFLGALHSLIWLSPSAPWNVVVPRAFKTAIFLVWWVAGLRAVNWLTQHSFAVISRRGNIGREIFYLFKNVIRVTVIVVGVLWILAIWQINLTPLFASAGIAGIAVALAAKDTLANFFGGISIFVDRTYSIGDYIILDSGERGEVVDIGIRSTRVKTRDDVLITIPNSILANAKIVNESAPLPRFRIRLPVGVAYGSDLKGVEEILVRVAKTNSMVSSSPEPRARIRAFADSSINFELLCWVDDPRDKGKAMHQLFNEIYDTFAKEGISIPFPQRDVHLQREDV